MVSSARIWNSTVRWQSPSCCVARNDREAVGQDGERYVWARIFVAEVHDGRVASLCQFDLEDEEAAFAYAEDRVRAAATRLPVTNRASQTWDAVRRAAHAHDVDTMTACYAKPFAFDDRRRLAGIPPDDLRTAQARILEQYNHFDGRTLAVRGERLHLGWTRWSNDAGFETNYLILHEVDESGRFIYEGRFDEDDFDAAYRELERRYGTGEGAAFAEGAGLSAEWMIALSEGDFDRLFAELSHPDLQVTNRSASAFPDRSAAEVRASFEELNSLVTSLQAWHSAVCWLSPGCCVARFEREGVGPDGEQYTWTRLDVFVVDGRRFMSGCIFELEDEEAAFAYAEERVREAGDN
jgi:hypothetical protein